MQNLKIQTCKIREYIEWWLPEARDGLEDLLFNNMFHDDFTARCLGLAFTVLFSKVNNMMNA